MNDFVKDFFDRENNDTIEYLTEIDKYEKFKEILTHKNVAEDLFTFALDYGCLYLLKYLYEIVGVSYNIKIFKNYMYLYDSEEQKLATEKQPIETDMTNNTQINIFYEDNYSKKRLECINYLCFMKRFSYCYYNNGFNYVFNKKNDTTI